MYSYSVAIASRVVESRITESTSRNVSFSKMCGVKIVYGVSSSPLYRCWLFLSSTFSFHRLTNQGLRRAETGP